MKCLFYSLVFLISGYGLSTTAMSEEITTEEMIQKLKPSSKTRSLKGISVDESTIKDQNPTINLYINFEYNSAELKQDALITLDNLAAALKDDRLSKFEFLIGGHTDAVGSDAFNIQLSEKRAWAVKSYLIKRHSVPGERLIEKGFGEARLLDPRKPSDAVNRRVQITTLTIPSQ
jgi:outer membrane protein OmpA-like peptidoglycan-associated protein